MDLTDKNKVKSCTKAEFIDNFSTTFLFKPKTVENNCPIVRLVECLRGEINAN